MKTNILVYFLSYLAHFFLEREMFQATAVEDIKTRFYLQRFFFSENRTVYEKMWKNILEPAGPQITIWRTRIACWITYLLTYSMEQGSS